MSALLETLESMTPAEREGIRKLLAALGQSIEQPRTPPRRRARPVRPPTSLPADVTTDELARARAELERRR